MEWFRQNVLNESTCLNNGYATSSILASIGGISYAYHQLDSIVLTIKKRTEAGSAPNTPRLCSFFVCGGTIFCLRRANAFGYQGKGQHF